MIILSLGVTAMLGSRPALADAFDEFMRRAGPATMIESSVILDVPWGGPVLHELSGAETGCMSKHSLDLTGITLDSDPFGIIPGIGIGLIGRPEADDPVGALHWRAEGGRDRCVTFQGREIRILEVRGDLYGKLTSLPAPVPSRCGGHDETVLLEIGDQPGWPAGFVEMYYAEGCGEAAEPAAEPIRVQDIRIRALVGSNTPFNTPRIIGLDAPAEQCLSTNASNRVFATIRLDVPPSPGERFGYRLRGTPPPFAPRSLSVPAGRTDFVFWALVPTDFVGLWEFRVEAQPTQALFSSASAYILLRSPFDPACANGQLNPARYEPRWDGCWNCLLRETAWRAPLIIHERMALGATSRLRNGIVARTDGGRVVAVSENTAGLPTSFILQGEDVIRELPGIQLRALSEGGSAVGARVEPKSQTRQAVWFDGEQVKELGTLGGPSSEALAISEEGWLVGWAEDGKGARRAFVAKDGTLEALPLPPHVESEATTVGGDRWIAGTLLTGKGQEGFLFDMDTGEVRLTGGAGEGGAFTFNQANALGVVLGALTTHHQEVVPVLFSAEQGLVRFDARAQMPQGFVPEEAVSLANDGSVLLAGKLDGVRAYFRFTQ